MCDGVFPVNQLTVRAVRHPTHLAGVDEHHVLAANRGTGGSSCRVRDTPESRSS